MSVCADSKKSSDKLVNGGGVLHAIAGVYGVLLGVAITRSTRPRSFLAGSLLVIGALVCLVLAYMALWTNEFNRDCSASALANNNSDPGVAPVFILVSGVAAVIVASAFSIDHFYFGRFNS